MKHIIIALSIVVATFAIFAMLFSVGLIGESKPQYQGFPLDMRVTRNLEDVNIAFEVNPSSSGSGYVYHYTISYSGDEPVILTWDVLNRMEKLPIFVSLEKGKTCEFTYVSPAPPVMCLGTAAIYKKTSFEKKFDFWKAASSSDFVGPASSDTNVPPVRWNVQQNTQQPLEIK